MQAIITKLLPATDTKGTRVKATCAVSKHSATVPYSYGLPGADENHAAALMALIRKLRKASPGMAHYGDADWHRGVTPDGYVWVATPRASD